MTAFCVAGGITLAKPDTVVVNQAEYRFPETHPGMTFLVKKLIVNGEGALEKTSSKPEEDGRVATPRTQSRPIGRDILGRSVRGEAYNKKLASLRAKYSLPVYAHEESFEVARGGKSVSLSRISRHKIREGSRFEITSGSPFIRNAADLARMEAEERLAFRRRYGNLERDFAKGMESRSGSDSVDVYVNLVVENPGFLDKRTASPEEQKVHARKWAHLRSVIRKDGILRRYGLNESSPNRSASDATSFVVRTSKSRILEMARDPAIATIEEKKKPGILSVPGATAPVFMDLINSAYNPPNQMVNHGSISVATQEMGLMDSFVSRLDPSERPADYDVFNPSIGGDSVHSAGTYHLLALGTPGMDRYHFMNGWYGTYAGTQDDLLGPAVKVISQSYYSWWATPLTADSRFVDRSSYVYPYTTFVMPTCNDGHEYAPCNQPYNALSVGNVQHYDLSTYNVDFWVWYNGSVVKASDWPYGKATQTKNPYPYYGSNPDREMPYLVAPGWMPDPYWGIVDSTIPWGPGGGTSLSAPVLAAITGNVISGLYSYRDYTELTRAVLLVTAENVDGGYWDPANSDQRDGAGTVSGANAVKFATAQGFYYGTQSGVSPGNWQDPAISAYGPNVLTQVDFDSANSHWYYYKAPEEIPEGMHLRVVLTWNSSPGLNYAENEISDLDLYVEADSYWATSLSMNGNTEMVDVSDLTPNGVYSIEVVPSIYRKATDGPEEVNYAIAWTWVKDHAD